MKQSKLAIVILSVMIIGLLVLSGCGKQAEVKDSTDVTVKTGDKTEVTIDNTAKEPTTPTQDETIAVDTTELDNSEEADLELDVFNEW